MSQNPLVQQAKQGNPEAIERLLNQSFQAQGVTAKVKLEHACLKVLLEGDSVPREEMANQVFRGMQKLQVSTIEQITVYGQAIEEGIPDWVQSFELNPSQALNSPQVPNPSQALNPSESDTASASDPSAQNRTIVYSAPESETPFPSTSTSASDPLVLASIGQRFWNQALDIIFFFLFCIVVGIILGILNLQLPEGEAADQGVGIVLLTLYYWPQEAIWGKTFAKFITKTKVVKADGSPLSPMYALVRTLCRLIPFDGISFLFKGNRPVGWHDQLSGTRVVVVQE